ncbi:reversal of tor2 lethality [Aspergillus niger]|nr:protein rot1 [Aspergillus niger CBS 101883]XP_026624018.1 protein rot1 [Aspergillus welwitschiae]KAI2814595.1 hypothetical protein CBS115989_8453 [Aspergillus niger]RDH16743.1 protein rot1 [Aspergillus niger ATCC 13496]KAI2832045.1 hypothetical protein CBS133816_1922 [Aspergillus niger]KAI2844304.1 hypothetical protein CBS11350_4735 [Aspergillus niger]KAI2853217.1 hypothetical protein CBS11232_5492 [Aspergillus niger]|eukprot:XP_001391241.2 protein rot1 [Aspergillus niger CBS 513.88]
MMATYFFLGLLLTAVGTSSSSSASDLEGTWTTKSRQVVTGPGFYDPIGDKFLEPNLTGISYSFSADGHYEEAYYRAIANPQDPSCPKGVMQWQHGTYTVNSDGSVDLTPIAVDGRQLLSDPCQSSTGTYTRYNQTEHFESFAVSVDSYHGVQRLDVKNFDGSPMHPMYLIYKPPQMLPTQTLNPSSSSKSKRQVEGGTGGRFSIKDLVSREKVGDPNNWLWLGIFMTTLGGITFFRS